MRPRLLLLLLFSVGLPITAHAASFDCTQAQTLREKTVCSDPKLSALDNQVALAYTAARMELSPEAAALIQSDQREWFRWLDQVCPPHNSVIDKTAECLSGHYEERLRQLTTDRVIVDGITFYARAHFVYVPGRPQPGDAPSWNDPGFGYGEFAWPQIDHPTDTQRSFNQAVYAATIKAVCCVDQSQKTPSLDATVNTTGYVDGYYTLVSANSHLIDVTLRSSSYTGGAHGFDGFIGFPWILDAQRLLKPEDIFATQTDWQHKLADLTHAKLLKDPGPDALWEDTPYTKAVDVKKAVAQEVHRPAAWELSSEGLTITFGSYEVGPYSSGMPSAHFTWQELSPWLAASFRPAMLPKPLHQTD